jgi:hypothetical protein
MQEIPTDGKAEPTDEIPTVGPSNDSGPKKLNIKAVDLRSCGGFETQCIPGVSP